MNIPDESPEGNVRHDVEDQRVQAKDAHCDIQETDFMTEVVHSRKQRRNFFRPSERVM